MARLSGRSKGTTALALLASTALLAGLIAGPGAVASGGDGATTSAKKKKKKKCKPGFKRVVIKKKGKKRRVCRRIQQGPPPGPRVRATISWTGGGGSSDMDLFVFDANGNRARANNNTIPNSAMTGNAQGPEGTESFTDTIFVTGGTTNRAFSFGVCQIDGGSHNLTVRIEYITPDGVTHVDSQVYNDNGADHQYPGGPAFPATWDLCNFLP